MQNMYDRLGDILRDRLDSDEDPFQTWEPHEGRHRQAGNMHERTPPQRARKKARIKVPDELVPEFMVLGLLPGVSLNECRTAWRTLLKKQHPDIHASSPDEEAYFTQKTRRITEAYRKIEYWYQTGKLQ